MVEKANRNLFTLGVGVFFLGLAVIFFVKEIDLWPWILALIGLAWLPWSLAKKKGWYGWNGCVWLVGLALLFYFHIFWPGILILIGISIAFGSLTRKAPGSPFVKP